MFFKNLDPYIPPALALFPISFNYVYIHCKFSSAFLSLVGTISVVSCWAKLPLRTKIILPTH